MIYLTLFVITFNMHANFLTEFFYKCKKIIFILQEFLINYKTIIYWLLLLPVSLIISEFIAYRTQMRKIIKRKLYHFIAILIFYPPLNSKNENFIIFISFIVLYIFIIIEILRKVLGHIKYIKQINLYLIKNIDERDDENFILTHTFLLYGSFSSLVYCQFYNINEQYKFIGLIVLGIGDSMVPNYFLF